MSEPSTPERGAPRHLVLALRMFLLVLAAGALCAAVLAGRARDLQSDSGVRYVCPMHAQVTSKTPGTCPLCGMKLEPVQSSNPPPIKSSTYETYDIMRRRAYGPNVPAPARVEDDGSVTAILYTDEIARRPVDERAIFAPSKDQSSETEVRATTDVPESWDGSTKRVRFRCAQGATPLLPGQVGWLRRAARSPEPPVLPYASVVEGADGPHVLALSADGRTLDKQPVQIGRVFGGAVAVLSGLRSSERVLTESAFFLDSERRLRGADTIEVAPR